MPINNENLDPSKEEKEPKAKPQRKPKTASAKPSVSSSKSNDVDGFEEIQDDAHLETISAQVDFMSAHNSIGTLKSESKKFKRSIDDNFHVIDLLANDTLGLVTKPVIIKRVVLNSASPRLLKMKFSAKVFEVDSVVHYLSEEHILKDVSTALASADFALSMIRSVTESNSGLFVPNNAIINYNQLISATKKCLTAQSFGSSDKVVAVVSAFYVDAINQLGLMQMGGSSVAIQQRVTLFSSDEDIILEMRKSRLRFAMQSMPKFQVKTTSKMSVGLVANMINENLQKVVAVLERMRAVEADLLTVKILIKSYITQNFERYNEDEREIFENDTFLHLAQNYTFVKIALDSNLGDRPVTGPYHWHQTLERVNAAIAESTMIEVRDINIIKEYFTWNIISDLPGLRKGVILTKNLVESVPFEAYRPLFKVGNFDRIMKDDIAEQAFSPLVDNFKKLSTKTIHDFSVKMMTTLTGENFPRYFIPSFVHERDLEPLGICLAEGVEIGWKSGKGAKDYTFVYKVSTDGARLTGLNDLMGLAKFTDPVATFFFAEDEHVGKLELGYKNAILDEVEDVNFLGLNGVSTEPLGQPVVMNVMLGTTTLKTTWDLDKLFGLPDMNKTKVIYPIVGNLIFSSLLQSYTSIVNAATKYIKADHPFGMVMSMSLLNILKPITSSIEVGRLYENVISQLASEGAAQSVDQDQLNSTFYRDVSRNELKFRLVMWLAHKFGYISTKKQIRSITTSVREGGGFGIS